MKDEYKDHIIAIQTALERKYGKPVEFCEDNNQYFAILPDGQKIPIKMGNEGSIRQNTHGTEYDARYTGIENAEKIIVSVRNYEIDNIRVYEVPGNVYRSEMRREYEYRVEILNHNKDTLRILRFDGRAYPEQQVAEKWEQYLINQEEEDSFMDNKNHQAALKALETKYEKSIQFHKKNNQLLFELPDGHLAPIKTGNKGTILQITDGTEYDANYTGEIQNAKTIIIAIRNSEREMIKVYEVPGKEYRAEMRKEYICRIENRSLEKTKLRALHFDSKGYPEQRVADKWEKYLISEQKTHEERNYPSNHSYSKADRPMPEDNESLGALLEKVKATYSRMSNVPESDVEISISIKK